MWVKVEVFPWLAIFRALLVVPIMPLTTRGV